MVTFMRISWKRCEVGKVFGLATPSSEESLLALAYFSTGEAESTLLAGVCFDLVRHGLDVVFVFVYVFV